MKTGLYLEFKDLVIPGNRQLGAIRIQSKFQQMEERKMKVRTATFYVFVLAALVLASCVPQATQPAVVATQAEPTEAAAEPTATEAAAEPTATEAAAEPTATEAAEPTQAAAGAKVATFIWTQEFDSLNPLYTSMWFSAITQQFWNCWPWDFDDQNNPHPVLVTEMPSAENGGISPDGKVITLKLRDGLVWSDGTPLTAKDFVFTYQMTIDPKNTVSSTNPYDLMESVEAPDDTTVVITFTDPYAPWVGTLFHGIMPEHIVKPQYDAEGTLDTAEWTSAPTVGCGPFVFEEWQSGSFARFVANENYWLGRPKIDEIFIRFVPDDASQIAALTAGDGDLGTFFAWSDVPTLEEAKIKVLKAFSGYNEGWYFNLGEKGHPAVKDARVRQAMAYAFDRFSLTKDLLLGGTVPAATYWDNTPYVDPALEPYPYDPEMAKQLLDEAGWKDSNNDGTRDKDGVELVLKYGTTTREVRVDTQAVAQQQLAEVGIKVELLNADSDVFFGTYGEGGPCATGQYDFFEYSTVTQYPDPDTAEWLCSEIPSDESPAGSNWMALCDEILDGLFTKQATQVDFAERQKTFYEITKYIFDQALWIGLWQDPDLFGISSRLSNVKISGATPFFNIIEWDIVE
jgi:peptide/nickel transport system substrate-binding protein